MRQKVSLKRIVLTAIIAFGMFLGTSASVMAAQQEQNGYFAVEENGRITWIEGIIDEPKSDVLSVSENVAGFYQEEETGKTKLPAPTGLQWDGWKGTWNPVDASKGYYWVQIWKDGEAYDAIALHGWDHQNYYNIDQHISESGVYKFRMYAMCSYDPDTLENSDWSDFSAEKTYVRPSRALGTTVGWWDETTPGLFHWNPVENAGGYKADLYYYDNDEGKYRSVVGMYCYSSYFLNVDFTDDIAKNGAGKYYVVIRALSDDIDTIANGEWGGQSEILDTSVNAAAVSNAISEALKASGNNVQQALAVLKEKITSAQLASAMQTDSGVLNQIKELEKLYTSQNNVSLSAVSVSYKAGQQIDSSRVSTVGSALNAVPDSMIGLKIDMSKDKIDVPSNRYAKSVQFDITLENNGTEVHELTAPVTITMPVPAGIPTEKLTIVHYSQDGTYRAVSFKENGDGTISFTVTHFSTFLFGMRADADGADEIPEGPNTWESKSGVEGFVYRLYNVALLREADEDGLHDWINRLETKRETAAQVAQGFIFSQEFKNKNYNDAQFVEILYRTMFGRTADSEGKEYWLSYLASGVSREYVYRGFAESQEFSNLCGNFGVERGTVTLSAYRDRNANATGFIARLYTKMLGRDFDDDGIEYWCEKYLTGEQSIEQIASNGFLHSDEFTNQNLSNEEFVTRMYRTFLNRAPEKAGLKDWVNRLETGEVTRDTLVYGFTNSQEFANLKAEYQLP